MEQPRKKRSPVWKHFEERPFNKEAQCLICKDVFKHHGNSSNLMKHLKTKHPQEVFALENKTETQDGACMPTGPKQRKLTEMSGPVPYTPDHPRKRLLDEQVVKMLCKDTRPIKMVEDQGFVDLMAAADPRYKLPCRKTVSTELLPKLYEDTKKIAERKLSEADHIAITTDLWSSRCNDSYMSLTAHFICKDWKQNSMVLKTHRFEGSHTGENIMQQLMTICQEWSIAKKVRILVSDSASNMLLAAKKLPWSHLPCFAHMLHLVVSAAVDSDNDLSVVIGKIKAVVGYFHVSNAAADRLTAMQQSFGLKERKLIQQVPTRWNSCLHMLESVTVNREAINAALGALGRSQDNITVEQDQMVKMAIKALKPFEIASTTLSADKVVTISTAIPLVKVIQKALTQVTDGREPLMTTLKAGMMRRFTGSEEKGWLKQSAMLDPRYKKNAFADQHMADLTIQGIQSEASHLTNSSTAHTANEDQPTPQEEEEEEDALWDFLGRPSTSIDPAIHAKTAAILEMRRYLELPNEQRKTNPLDFWKKNSSQFPYLSAVAKKYLCAPATSVSSERLFSKAGELISARRSCLSPKNVDMLLFLNKNL